MKKNGEERHEHRKIGRFEIIVITAVICVAVGLLVVYGIQVFKRRQAEDLMGQLADLTWSDIDYTDEAQNQEPNSESTKGQKETESDSLKALIEMGVPIPEKEVDFAALKEEVNEDIYAWIYIPDSDIDYPVLQHPTDNAFYLEYNIDGSKGRPGCIYTEDYNSKDFTDPNTVIYGHNITSSTKPGTTMFHDLHKFEDSKYFEENPYVYIYTEEGLLVYEVFAAYVTGNEHVLFSCDFGLPSQYSKYLENIFEIQSTDANIREELTVTNENRILTLSTCVYGRKQNRYLVQGVLLNES